MQRSKGTEAIDGGAVENEPSLYLAGRARWRRVMLTRVGYPLALHLIVWERCKMTLDPYSAWSGILGTYSLAFLSSDEIELPSCTVAARSRPYILSIDLYKMAAKVLRKWRHVNLHISKCRLQWVCSWRIFCSSGNMHGCCCFICRWLNYQ